MTPESYEQALKLLKQCSEHLCDAYFQGMNIATFNQKRLAREVRDFLKSQK